MNKQIAALGGRFEMTKTALTFIDLFAGVGGFRLGMEMAGHKCIGFCEIDKFARQSYTAIHETEKEVEMHDITKLSDKFIRSMGSVNVLCGGFPCQAFSIAGNRRGFADTRGTLFFEIARFASLLRPSYLFLENVRGLLNHDNGNTFETILQTLDDIGYDVEWEVLNSKNYVPLYHLKLRDITTEDIEDWMFELSQIVSKNMRFRPEKTTLSKSYINRLRGHLKIILDRAVKEGLIDKNPVNDVSYLPLENKKVDFWEVEDFQKVMLQFEDSSITSKNRKLVFELLFYTGLRIGELSALPWKRVNLEKNQITVEKTLIYSKKDEWYFSTPKTKNSYRTIGIGKVLSNKLAEWRQLQNLLGSFEYVIQLDGTFTPPYSFASWLKDALWK